ncbi:MAG TPA: SigB/SigF/SigG family RNA polymerase sigma factor [Conexibacter sp.]|jgi:RNA polymerase sigma-B factor
MSVLTPQRRSVHRFDGEALVNRYHATGDPQLRDLAVRQYMPLARKLAKRYGRTREPLDDLLQVAYLGLVKAVDRYDPSVGTRFGSYAIPTISGELRRHFRDATWAVHVPRGVQEASLDVTKATADLSNRLGRAPSVRQIAEETGFDLELVIEALHAREAQEIASLDQPRSGDEDASSIADSVGRTDERFDLIDHRVTVAPLLRALPEREREVLRLRFGHDMTQTEIAARVGCSQMQVSRLIRRAIARLSQVSDEPQPLPGASASPGRAADAG